MSELKTSVLKHSLKAITATVLLVGVLLIAPGSVAAQETTPTEQTVTTQVNATGDATIAVRLQYDLTDDTQREAFEQLSADESLVQETKTRFTDRMDSVAAAITNTTDRTVTVTDTRIAFTQSNTTGTVTLEADLSNLAKQEQDGSLTLTEPFASGFSFDGDVKVVAPDGHVIDGTTPSADQTPSENVRVWSTDTSLDGFEVTMVDDGDATTSTETPGMGVIVGLLALFVSIGLVAFNRF